MFLLFGILSNPDCKSYGLEYGIANPVQRGKGFKKEFLLPTEKLPNGLYRVILSNRKETKSANFQILK